VTGCNTSVTVDPVVIINDAIAIAIAMAMINLCLAAYKFIIPLQLQEAQNF
jgi:hypothetical protein